MENVDKLQELLTKLPGIGPRQARRFAYFFLSVNQDYIDSLVYLLQNLRSIKFVCRKCNRLYFLTHTHKDNEKCAVCLDSSRDQSKLLLVSKQADLENVERAAAWDGRYFVLNRVVKMSDKNPLENLPIDKLRQALSEFELKEVVMGLPINPEGEFTSDVLIQELKSLLQEGDISTSQLGRGLSVGSELEYSDPQTIEQALKNRQ